MEYKWKVKKSEHGMSLENFIYKYMGDWSHKRVKQAIDNKRAFVNGRNVFISKWNVKGGDTVLFVPTKKDSQGRNLGDSRYKFIEVLFEDNYIIAANKPAFVDHEQFSKSVQGYLKRQNRGEALPYLGQMHRLDKETSGVMIFTKKKAANGLADQFRDHTIQKSYIALAVGEVDIERGRIGKPIEKGHFEEGKKARINSRSPEAKRAITDFEVKERYNGFSLMKVNIQTGRTHQIRVHLADMGHPLVGDKLYGQDQKAVQEAAKMLKLNRHALHADQLIFKHPVTKAKTKVNAPLPMDMAKAIQYLRENV